MKEEILSIASDLREGHISSNQAKHLLLVLFGVEGRSEHLCQFEQDQRYDSSTCKHCGGQ
jgi:hypothetical protein